MNMTKVVYSFYCLCLLSYKLDNLILFVRTEKFYLWISVLFHVYKNLMYNWICIIISYKL